MQRQLEKLEEFRAGVDALGMPYDEAWSQALCRLLRSARAGGIPEGKPRFTEQPRWRKRMEQLIDAIPERFG